MATLPQLQGLNLSEILPRFERGQEQQRVQQERKALAEFAPAAMQGDQTALAKLGAINPQLAIQISSLQQQKAATTTAASRDDRNFAFRKEQAALSQSNADRAFAFEQTKFFQDQNFKTAALNHKIGQALQKPKTDPKLTQDLRKEFVALSKDFIKVRDAFGRIQAIASVKDPEGVDDIGLIFNYMKMLDPGSVVRESEFRTLESAQGVPDQLMTFFQKLKSGQKLTEDTRARIGDAAKRLLEQQRAQQDQLFDTFERLADNAGVNKNDVAIELGLVDPAQSPQQTNVSTMSLQQLQSLDPSTMSDEELQAASARIRQLSGN